MPVIPAAAALMLLAGAAPAAATDAGSLPAGDSAAWRSAMLGWSIESVPPPETLSLLMERPLATGRLSSSFGGRADPMTGSWRAHRGVDIAAPAGTPIVASSDGVITFAGAAGGYGEMVQIDHAGGLQTRYGHLSRILARSGDIVRRGEIIGTVGSTGRSTGSHLHFEIRLVGSAVDPTRPLPGVPPSSRIASEPAVRVVPRWQGWTVTSDHLPAAFR